MDHLLDVWHDPGIQMGLSLSPSCLFHLHLFGFTLSPDAYAHCLSAILSNSCTNGNLRVVLVRLAASEVEMPCQCDCRLPMNWI